MRLFDRPFSAIILLIIVAGNSFAGDWPQILGPHRSGFADNEKLVSKLDKPPQQWEAAIGSGVAGVAVRREVTICFHRLGNNDRCEAFDSTSGKSLWSASFPTSFQSQILDDNGPRCVPLISGDTVFLFSAEGNLHAVSISNGKPLWSRDTAREFGAPQGYFGAGSTPLVDDNKVILNVGGSKKNAGIVAFDTKTGDTLWQLSEDQASYSNPIVATIEGQRIYVVLTRANLVAVNADSGKEMCRYPFGQRGPTVNAAAPVLFGDQVLLTASYGIGARLVKLTPTAIREVWEAPILSSQYTTPIVKDGFAFGVDGRQDGGTPRLICFEIATRKIQWSQELTDYATLIAADGKLLIMRTDGVLEMATLTSASFQPLGTATLAKSTTRALPALAGGRLYVRDKTTLHCINLTDD